MKLLNVVFLVFRMDRIEVVLVKLTRTFGIQTRVYLLRLLVVSMALNM